MASAAVQSAPAAHSFEPIVSSYKDTPKTSSQGRNVESVVNYFLDNGQPPAPSYVGRPETYIRPADPRQVTVNDVRGRESEYTLDRNGFQYIKHTSVEKDFVNDEQIKAQYYPEVEQLLKDATGASKVFIFDHTIRRAPPEGSTRPDATLRGPVQRVHIDQSYKAGRDRVSHHFPDPSVHNKLLQGRYQIINVWRPIKTIHKDPLAIAEANSVPDTDLLPVQLIYPDRVGETFTVKPNEKHQWFYLHGQTPEEPLLIKCFDSEVDGRARRVPHTSFADAEYENSEARESIEVRTLVFHEI